MISFSLQLISILAVESVLTIVVSIVLLVEVETVDIHCNYIKCSGLRAAGVSSLLNNLTFFYLLLWNFVQHMINIIKM